MSQFAISTNVYWGQDRYGKLSIFLRSLKNLELNSAEFSKEDLRQVLASVCTK